MQIGESIRTSFEEVKGHPLRSFFTLIGVILGTLDVYPSLVVGDDGAGSAMVRVAAESLDEHHFYYVDVHESEDSLFARIACGRLDVE